uniref:GST C-terminal domain-containing protein n=1 Tax=Oryza nivara TaxID=4536 RepID=A0A0E0IXL6_ORYNI
MEQLLVLEKVLHENKFFGGERIGFVDLSLGSLSYVIPIYEDITGVRLITSDKFPWLSAWMEGFLGLPLVKEHLPPLDKLRPRIGFVDLSLGSLSYVIPIYEDITGVRLITSDKFPWLSAWMEGFLGLPLVKEHLLPLDKLRPRGQLKGACWEE